MAGQHQDRGFDRFAVHRHLTTSDFRPAVFAAGPAEARQIGFELVDRRLRPMTSNALSHVSFVIGFGHSCSQPLLANRPSWIVGSGRNVISTPLSDEHRVRPSPNPCSRRGRRQRLARRFGRARRFRGQPSHQISYSPFFTFASKCFFHVADTSSSGRLFDFAEHRREQFDGRLAAVHRGTQRLLNARRAVVAAGIAPRFEEVGFVDVPAGRHGRGRFIDVRAEVKLILGLLDALRRTAHRPER